MSNIRDSTPISYVNLSGVIYAGAYAGFLRGGLNFKIFGILDIHEYTCREQRSCEPLLGGFGGMHPKKIFKNGAISCVLRAIFSHFHGKKSSKKNYK